MAEIMRKAGAVWEGDLKRGRGYLNTESGAVRDEPYSFGTRWEKEPGTNPEELIGVAHAGCYSMALAFTLSSAGYAPERIETDATVTLSPLEQGGWRISKVKLDVRARVPGADESELKELSKKAHEGCPVSNALKGGPEIDIAIMSL
ncbi:MAG TPA: OsmC family peroxiredoxin [Chloroflexi bacterium]|nr:OsmC family peroxiredoxin [Chloroflexota bacterium]